MEDGKTIIVTTLQNFPVIADQMGALKGKRFAVIIDEAHPSQSGESTKSLKSVLTAETLEKAEKQAIEEGFILDVLTNYTTFQTYWALLKKTLSRLNRTCPPDKEDTMVLDFANEADEIQKTFPPYYERTLLKEATDPNLLYDLQTKPPWSSPVSRFLSWRSSTGTPQLPQIPTNVLPTQSQGLAAADPGVGAKPQEIR